MGRASRDARRAAGESAVGAREIATRDGGGLPASSPSAPLLPRAQTPAASPPPPAAPPADPAPRLRRLPPRPPRATEKIVGIRVVGYQTVSPDTIAHYLGVKVGDPYDPEKIRDNFQTLWDVGLLENVSIEAERGAGGVTLIVTIEERPTIKEVDFTGNKKFSTRRSRTA